MKCLILAAGYATRLYPLTENFPKPLLDVQGKTILDWLVEDIASCGIREFLVVTNHRFAGHFEAWAAARPEAIRVIDDGTSTNETRLGAVRDIALAAREEEDYLVIAGDNLLDFSFGGFIHFFQEHKAPCVMTHEEKDPDKQRKTAIITFEADGRITSYEEKPLQPKGNHAVPPFYCYRAQDIRRIPEALAEGCGYDAPGSFAAWLSSRTPVYAYEMPGKRYDIGDMESYRKVQEEALFAISDAPPAARSIYTS